MTDDEINIATHEACGWLPRKHCKGWYQEEGTEVCLERPSYCTDQNAIGNAVTLKNVDPIWYAIQLRNVVTRQHDRDDQSFDAAEVYCIATATARLRAEAFLRTVGKWTE